MRDQKIFTDNTQMKKQIGNQINKQTGKQINQQSKTQTSKQINQQSKTQTSKQINQQSNKQTDKMEHEQLNEFKNIIKQCDILLMLYILKTTTNSENAMSVTEVSEQLDALFSTLSGNSYFPDRTMRRKFELFSLLATSKEAELCMINKLFPFVFGGNVSSRAADGIEFGTNTRSNGKQKRFYFNPVLSFGDMDLIFGSIESNRYLSEAEKNYLLARLRILLPDYNFDKNKLSENSYRHILQMESLPARPKKAGNANLPMDTSTLLSHIQMIHDAIQNENQIEIIYGTYDICDDSKRVRFHARNEEKPYILNPYAMLWNDGDYYLIATHNNHTNPVHFRIDRIISVKVHTTIKEDGILNEEKRKKIPDSLTPFFIKEKGLKPVFDSIKYSNTYPGMKIYQNKNLVDCCFECTTLSLQILIDNFGPDIKLAPSPIKHSDKELDYNGKPQTFLAATIKDIQYDNALRFCIEQSQYLTLLKPENLVADVKDTLHKIVNRYESVTS